MKTILSTKKLNQSQKEHLLNADLAVVDVDFIKTEVIVFESPSIVKNAIFTSQNGVKAVLSKGVEIKNAFCVGERTRKLIEKEGIRIKYTGKNAEELSTYIIEQSSNEEFYYFCAVDRLNVLPNALSQNKVQWEEIQVYKTIFTPKKYNQQYNGVLFFSPSGVESYFGVNQEPEHSFCIGNTTAKSLKKYTKKYTVASQTTVENVLVKAIKHFKND